MATGSLLTLLDDIATLLDDVSLMTKIAAKKTAGVLGDDLALNAQQLLGVASEREIPIVWAVAKGSFVNKLILVPSALAISYVAPWAISPLLMTGGAFLCFEGVEKLAHKFFHAHDEETHRQALSQAHQATNTDLVAFEQDKIKGAIRTDFVLSAEIIVIALGSVAEQSFGTQIAVVSAIALLMTIGVYGFVAAIVKMDDFGLFLLQVEGRGGLKKLIRKIGQTIIMLVPYLMRALSFLGTAAMFLVGGSIILHGIPGLYHEVEGFGGWSVLLDCLFGVATGTLVLSLVMLVKKLKAVLF